MSAIMEISFSVMAFLLPSIDNELTIACSVGRKGDLVENEKI